MRSRFIASLRRAASLALAMGVVGAAGASAQEALVGDWEGAIASPQQGDIEMVFHITAAEDGGLAATLDVPSQAGFGIPLEDVTFEDGVFSFALPSLPGGASYEGELAEDGAAMTGMWTQGGTSIELDMTKSEDGR